MQQGRLGVPSDGKRVRSDGYEGITMRIADEVALACAAGRIVDHVELLH
jgi:hypothetical protein